MLEALPEDVQALLRRKGPPRGPSATPVDLAIEARDARMASDVVIQFLAYRWVRRCRTVPGIQVGEGGTFLSLIEQEAAKPRPTKPNKSYMVCPRCLPSPPPDTPSNLDFCPPPSAPDLCPPIIP